MYKVVEFFHDLKDGGHAYKPGDVFPREGVKASAARLTELSSANNARGVKLIEKVVEKKRKRLADDE